MATQTTDPRAGQQLVRNITIKTPLRKTDVFDSEVCRADGPVLGIKTCVAVMTDLYVLQDFEPIQFINQIYPDGKQLPID